MNNHHPLESIVGIILEHYAQDNEYGLKAGDDFLPVPAGNVVGAGAAGA